MKSHPVRLTAVEITDVVRILVVVGRRVDRVGIIQVGIIDIIQV